MPGLFTRISIDPKTLATCCDCCLDCAGIARVAGDSDSVAASRLAIAPPMLREPPVTMAIFERPGSAFHNAVHIVWLGKLKRFSFTQRYQAYADVALTILTCV